MEVIRTMRIVADRDLEIVQQVEKLQRLSHPNPPPDLGLRQTLLTPNYFFDLRSSDSFEQTSTLNQGQKVRLPNPDHNDVSSQGYTRAKPIPKKN